MKKKIDLEFLLSNDFSTRVYNSERNLEFNSKFLTLILLMSEVIFDVARLFWLNLSEESDSSEKYKMPRINKLQTVD